MNNDNNFSPSQIKRIKEVFNQKYNELAVKTDQLFGYLFIFQWLLGIALAYFISPQTWAGENSSIHIHVYAAIFLGGIIAAVPIYLAFTSPGATINRMVIAVAQILFSILYIHFTGGRIETHFHIFGSLAFLAFYRDWRPILIATFMTIADHFIRGFFWPQSLYGVLSATPWRAIEHGAWVLFEDIFILYSIRITRGEIKSISEKQMKLEDKTEALRQAHLDVSELNKSLEIKVDERTKQLQESQLLILNQQQALIATSKMSALGEMAGGVAHEINTPLAVISMRAELMEENINEKDVDLVEFLKHLNIIKSTVDRIAKIIGGLRFFAREGQHEMPQKTEILNLIQETLVFCYEKFSSHGVQLTFSKNHLEAEVEVDCRAVEISQVILNLLNNSYEAVQKSKNPWIRIEVLDQNEFIEIVITDSGNGISKNIQDKIMQPFFTTKDIGKGTGLGLSISKGIIEEHGGSLYLNELSPNTQFVIRLPKFHLPME